MIVSFSVANFRSFSSEETLSLVASNRLSTRHEDHAVPIPDSTERVLRTAVLYGANGAGKSNLFKALRFLRTLAMRMRRKGSGTGRETFRFGEYSDQPTCFDLQFIVQERLYRFGVKIDDHKILEEWLVRVTGGRETVLYERVTSEKGAVTIEVTGIVEAGPKLRALATVGGLQNQSFLATLQATLDPAEYGDELRGILGWFSRGLTLIAPTQSFRSLGQVLAKDPELLSFAGEFLKSASTGVDHLKILKKELSEEELREMLPEAALADILGRGREEESRVIPLDEGSELLIEPNGVNRYYRIRIQAAHDDDKGHQVPLELSEESDGTRRLLHLIPALHRLQKSSGVFFIDEIDRSLHPMLVRAFLESFLKCCEGGHRQVIVTTHESSLLDQDLLRRDEIWFAEKDHTSATKLYSLSDFRVRNDLEIRKHYLQGRFGAVPFLGALEQLAEQKDSVA